MYQRTDRPTDLFEHIFGETKGHLVTFTGMQARFVRSDARHNELTRIEQRSFPYPDRSREASDYLISQAQKRRDCYVGVHLFRMPSNRLAANAMPTVGSLWFDEDGGQFPEIGPEPTAVVRSSSERRHLYWRLTQAVTVEWAVKMNRRVACWAGGDIGKAGLASVLRVPGTMNYKRHPKVDAVTMEITGTRPWNPEVLEQAIPEIQREPCSSTAEPYDGPEMELQEFLRGVEVLGEAPDTLGTKVAIVCPWISEHTGGDRSGTYVGRRRDGGLWFYCHHQHCQRRTWRDFRRRVGRKRLLKITRPGYAGSLSEVNIHRA